MALTKEALFDIYNQTINNIESGVANRTISPEDEVLLKENAINEFNEYLAQVENIEFSDYDDDVAEFNGLGEVLLGLGDELGYDDAEDYILDLAEAYDVEPEDLVDVMTDEDLEDEEAYEVLDSMGLLDDEEDYEVDDNGDYYDINDEYEEDDDEEYVDDEANYRIAELENTIAEFQINSEILSVINRQENRAIQMVDDGNLPPAAFSLLFQTSDGEMLEDDEKIAAFSATADANQYDIATQLAINEAVLDVFDRLNLSETGLFSQIVEDQISEYNMSEDAQIEELARKSIEYRNRKEMGLI